MTGKDEDFLVDFDWPSSSIREMSLERLHEKAARLPYSQIAAVHSSLRFKFEASHAFALIERATSQSDKRFKI